MGHFLPLHLPDILIAESVFGKCSRRRQEADLMAKNRPNSPPPYVDGYGQVTFQTGSKTKWLV